MIRIVAELLLKLVSVPCLPAAVAFVPPLLGGHVSLPSDLAPASMSSFLSNVLGYWSAVVQGIRIN